MSRSLASAPSSHAPTATGFARRRGRRAEVAGSPRGRHLGSAAGSGYIDGCRSCAGVIQSNLEAVESSGSFDGGGGGGGRTEKGPASWCGAHLEGGGDGKRRRAQRRRRRSGADLRESSAKRLRRRGRMDEFISSLGDASVGLHEQPELMHFDCPPPGVGDGPAANKVDATAPSRARSNGTGTKNKQTNFSAYEDNVLCKAWLEISCDPVTNTGQRKESFWGRVVNRYNSQRGNYPERSLKSLMSRWDFIKAEVSKFSGYMAEMIRRNPSSMNDSDKSLAAAADFAAIEQHNFCLMHCWNILKDEPKWMDQKRKMDRVVDNAVGLDAAQGSNYLDLDPPVSSPSSCTGKRPMGRDAAKATAKKASSSSARSSEYASKMHKLSIEKVALFKETEVERKARLDELFSLEKAKVEDAREHRRTMLELERERLEMEKKRLELKVQKKAQNKVREDEERRKEEEKKAKEEDERILAINLDECQPYQRMYYEAMQEEIIERMKARRRGSTQ